MFKLEVLLNAVYIYFLATCTSFGVNILFVPLAHFSIFIVLLLLHFFIYC